MSFHSEEWYDFITSAVARPSIRAANPLILQSWQRSFEAGVRPDSSEILLTRLPEDEIQQRLAENRLLIEAAKPLLDSFSRDHAAVQHVIYLVDAQGIVLYSQGNNHTMRAYGLSPGYDWSESRMGTNGAGTALASRRPVAVVGPDHYQLPFHDCTCLASPVWSATGDLVGAIDFSSRVGDASPDQLDAVIEVSQQLAKKLARGHHDGAREAGNLTNNPPQSRP